MIKYHVWYDQIIDRARNRDIPRCYCEWHHIRPKSFGGNDSSSNLVLLTYREHFLAHWLLTKITRGADLRKMQRALFAMTMPLWGGRIISGWQFEAAKRAIRDLELDPAIEAAWRRRYLAEKEEKKLKDKEIQYFARVGRRHERDANRALVQRLAESGKLDKKNATDAAHVLLQNNRALKRGRFKGLGMSAEQVEFASMRAWRHQKSAPLAKKAKLRLEAILGA